MKFKVAVIAILIAILGINSFMAYTVIQEEKMQTNNINALIRVKAEEYATAGKGDLYELLRTYSIVK